MSTTTKKKAPPEAWPLRLLRGFRVASSRLLRERGMVACEHVVGDVVNDDSGRGIVVAVKVYRYSEALRRSDPDSSGILAHRTPPASRRKRPRPRPRPMYRRAV